MAVSVGSVQQLRSGEKRRLADMRAWRLNKMMTEFDTSSMSFSKSRRSNYCALEEHCSERMAVCRVEVEGDVQAITLHYLTLAYQHSQKKVLC